MDQRLDVTDRIVSADLCTGCGACAALAPDKISFGISDDGFLRPEPAGVLPRKLARRVMDVCPGGGQVSEEEDADPLWGAFRAVYQGWAVDEALRHAGASGGALSAMCLWLLESGRVDGVVQITADRDDPIANRTVVSRTWEDVLSAAASRYAPSAPLLEVPALAQTGERYAFVGKPCDVAALRRWAAADADVKRAFPVLLSFFCAGVPSLAGAAEIVEALGVDADDVASFRYRGNGWPGKTEVTNLRGQVRAMTYHESWGGILSKKVQPRCRICADGTGTEADIAFADAWETDEAGYPLFEEQKGCSLIVARSSKGLGFLHSAKAVGVLEYTPIDPAEIAKMQPGQLRRRRELLGRLAGRVLAGLPLPKYRRMGIWACARDVPFRTTVRVALGMAHRCMLRRRSAK